MIRITLNFAASRTAALYFFLRTVILILVNDFQS